MKRVVIIGGGFAGSGCAKNLEKDFAVTLLDKKDYFEFTPSILRMAVRPDYADIIRVPYSVYLTETNIIHQHVSTITNDNVKTISHDYPYDYLIIASGARYGLPFHAPNLVIASHGEGLRTSAEKVRNAQEILIIGAGFVGIELAGEIVEAYPGKKIKVLEMMPLIMGRSPKKAQVYVRTFLEQRGVEFILGEKLEKVEGTAYMTDKGTVLKPDIAFLSTGITPHYEHLEGHCSAHLNPRNFLCVNDYLQVGDFTNVFAAGDVTAISEEKTAHNAERHAEIVVKNIYHLEHHQPLEKYKTASAPLVISLGRKNGVFTSPKVVFGGRIPGLMKRMIEKRELRKYR